MQKERFTTAKCNEKKYSFEIMKRTKLVNDLSFDNPYIYCSIYTELTGLRGVDAMYQYNTVLHNTVPYVVHNWLTVHDVVIMDMEPIF